MLRFSKIKFFVKEIETCFGVFMNILFCVNSVPICTVSVSDVILKIYNCQN